MNAKSSLHMPFFIKFKDSGGFGGFMVLCIVKCKMAKKLKYPL